MSKDCFCRKPGCCASAPGAPVQSNRGVLLGEPLFACGFCCSSKAAAVSGAQSVGSAGISSCLKKKPEGDLKRILVAQRRDPQPFHEGRAIPERSNPPLEPATGIAVLGGGQRLREAAHQAAAFPSQALPTPQCSITADAEVNLGTLRHLREHQAMSLI